MLADVVRRGGGDVPVPDIGEPFMGGFFAGIIDTTQGNIIAEDQYQTGARYALIISPASLEDGSGLKWYAPDNYSGDTCKTRWDGLEAQRAALAEHGDDFEAFDYCAGLSHPDDEGSEWYLPALDELELCYRNLKPTTDDNAVDSRSGDFPPTTQEFGDNPSSDPAGDPYTASDPQQTSVSDFQDGGSEAFQDPGAYYWAATWYSSSGAWLQRPEDGDQSLSGQDSTSRRVRPVRRLVL